MVASVALGSAELVAQRVTRQVERHLLNIYSFRFERISPDRVFEHLKTVRSNLLKSVSAAR